MKIISISFYDPKTLEILVCCAATIHDGIRLNPNTLDSQPFTDEANEMNRYRRFKKSMLDAFEQAGRAKVLVELRRMSPSFLIQVGYSPELLRQGLSAWPWRLTDEASASETKDESAATDGNPGANLANRSIGRSTPIAVVPEGGVDTDPKAA